MQLVAEPASAPHWLLRPPPDALAPSLPAAAPLRPPTTGRLKRLPDPSGPTCAESAVSYLRVSNLMCRVPSTTNLIRVDPPEHKVRISVCAHFNLHVQGAFNHYLIRVDPPGGTNPAVMLTLTQEVRRHCAVAGNARVVLNPPTRGRQPGSHAHADLGGAEAFCKEFCCWNVGTIESTCPGLGGCGGGVAAGTSGIRLDHEATCPGFRGFNGGARLLETQGVCCNQGSRLWAYRVCEATFFRRRV